MRDPVRRKNRATRPNGQYIFCCCTPLNHRKTKVDDLAQFGMTCRSGLTVFLCYRKSDRVHFANVCLGTTNRFNELLC